MQHLGYLKESPSQTAGPYVHIGLTPNAVGIHGVYPADLGLSPIRQDARGTRVSITGTVRDGAGMVLRDALVESWQADAAGLYPGRDGADPAVSGWARLAANADSGEWRLDTVKPGSVPFPDGRLMAPHIALWIVARGINLGLQTRMYFEDEDNSACPVLAKIEHQARVQTLMAKRTGANAYRFDIVLQGADESIFFDM